MDPKKTQTKPKEHNSVWRFLKRSFWAGVATLFPLFITIYAIVFIFRFVDDSVGKYINMYLAEHYNITMPGIGLLVLFMILIGVGLLSRIFVGRWITSIVDKLFNKTPLIANIYPSAKKLSDFLFADEEQKKKFRKVVLVEFPTPGSWSLGFVTNEQLDGFQDALPEDYVCVFVPLAPAPFSGFVYWAARDKVKEIDMSVDHAVRFILSGGVVSK